MVPDKNKKQKKRVRIRLPMPEKPPKQQIPDTIYNRKKTKKELQKELEESKE